MIHPVLIEETIFIDWSISVEGIPATIAKCAEELNELSAELNKYLSQILNERDGQTVMRNNEEIHGEMTDVYIMMEKLRRIMRNPPEELFRAKLNRHKKTLGYEEINV